MFKVTIQFFDAPQVEFWSNEVGSVNDRIMYWDTSDEDRVSYPISRIKSVSEKYYEDKK